MMVQSSELQHVACGMQLFDVVQVFCAGGHAQLPPAPEQSCPATVQSAVVQQFTCGMHVDEAVQALKPDRQLHGIPGLGQTSPTIVVQSLLMQQVPLAMQLADAWHVCWFDGHTQVPVESHVWPRYGHCSGRYVQVPLDVQTAPATT